MSRVLARTRISKADESSTALDGQRQDIERWAELHGHTIVGWAEDENVSGAISPFEAPALAPWLGDRSDEWDVLVAWKLDRLGRGLFDFADLMKWCEAHGKAIACIRDNVDISTSMGKFVATIIAGIAELERDAMKTRINAERDRNRKNGNYHGGLPPFGYRAVKRDGEKGWELVPDPTAAETLRSIFSKVPGQSIRSIARELNDQGVPAPKGGVWHPETISNMVRSRYPLGYVEHDGQLVIGDDGNPVRREPIVTQAVYDRANEALNGRGRPTQRKNETALLAGVLYCDNCECEHVRRGGQCPDHCPGKAPLYSEHTRVKGRTYPYYRCKNRCRSIPMDRMDAWAEEDLLGEIGDVRRVERVRVSGGDARVIADLTHRINDLTARLISDPGNAPAIVADMSRASAELEKERNKGDAWEVRDLGETYGQAWARSDTDDRRAMLRDSGIRFHARMGSVVVGDDGERTIVNGRQLWAHTFIDGNAIEDRFPGYVPLHERAPIDPATVPYEPDTESGWTVERAELP